MRRWKLKFTMLVAIWAWASSSSFALDLLQAYRQALINDPGFLSAKADNEATQEVVPQARAGLLPVLSASSARYGSTTNEKYRNLVGRMGSATQDYLSRNDSLVLRQPLLRLANVARYFQAEAQVAASDASLENEKQTLAVKVASAYFDALLGIERIDYVASQTQTYRGQLDLARRAFSTGEGTRTDIDEAQASLDKSLAQEIEARNMLVQAERALSVLLGEPVHATELRPLDADRLLASAILPDSLDELVARAEANNPDLVAWRHNVEAAERDLDRARADHLPTVDLVANRTFSMSETPTTIGTHYWTTQVGVQASIPLFAGGQTMSEVRQAHARLEKARQQYELARRQLGQEVGKQYEGVVLGAARIRAADQAFVSARQASISTRKGAKAGTRNNIDILNAQQKEFSAHLDLAQARFDFAAAWLRLQAAVGELNEDTMQAANSWLRLGRS